MTTQLPLFDPPAPPTSATVVCVYCRRLYVCAVGYVATTRPACGGEVVGT